MNYLTWIQPQISPKYVVVHGPTADETVLNCEGILPLPVGVVYQPKNWDVYSADPAARTVICQTLETGSSDAEIFAACPLFKDWKAGLVRNEGEFRLNQLVGDYQQSERRTWPQQRDEAIRHFTGGITATPYCDAIAAAAGISREEFLQAVYDRIAPYDVASSLILGQQRAQLSVIYGAQTVQAVLDVTWP